VNVAVAFPSVPVVTELSMEPSAGSLSSSVIAAPETALPLLSSA